jgi:hypothetical protein
LEKYLSFRKIDYSGAKLLNKNKKETILKNILTTAKKRRAEQNSVSFEINGIGSQPKPTSRNEFLDAVFAINIENKKNILKIEKLLEGTLDKQTIIDDFRKNLPREVRDNEVFNESFYDSLVSWSCKRYTYNEETVWANFKIYEIFNGNRKQVWTYGNYGVQNIKIDTEHGSIGYSSELNQVVVNEEKSRFPDEMFSFFNFFFLPFHDDKISSSFANVFFEVYHDDRYLYILINRDGANSYISAILCCDAISYDTYVYRSFDKQGNIIKDVFQFEWTKFDRGINVPKIFIEGQYDPNEKEQGKETLNYYLIRYLQKIDQFPKFKDDEFQLACKKGTEVIDFRVNDAHKSFILDQDVANIMDYMWSAKPTSFAIKNNNENITLRIIFVIAGIITLVISLIIRIYQKKEN